MQMQTFVWCLKKAEIQLYFHHILYTVIQEVQQTSILTDMSLLYSSSLCLLEAMKSPPFWIQPVWRPISSSRSLLITFLVWARSSTSTSLGRSCHSKPNSTHRGCVLHGNEPRSHHEVSNTSRHLQIHTCSVPGGASGESVFLQQNYIGHPHFSQVVDGLTAQAASSDHNHICWSETVETQLLP